LSEARILYHVTIPRSPIAECEAVTQDIRLLQQVAPGELFHLYPARVPGTRIPRLTWGLTQLPALWRRERSARLHHVFNPDPFPFAVLRLLRRPVVYTVVGGIHADHREMACRLARLAHRILVSSLEDEQRLRGWGIEQAQFIPPAIDASRFSHTPLPPGARLTLLAGSAPWTTGQFTSKGVDALLEAAQHRTDLHLVFLWRGILYEEMMERVQARGLGGRVRVLNERVDVNMLLAEASAAVVLADRSDVVKAYPHSLLESLAAGKPVLVSRAIPMARWVEQAGLGVVVDRVEADCILAAIADLQGRSFSPGALRAAVEGRVTQFQQAHQDIYRSVAEVHPLTKQRT